MFGELFVLLTFLKIYIYNDCIVHFTLNCMVNKPKINERQQGISTRVRLQQLLSQHDK